MAVVLGKLALILDVTSPRAIIIDLKTRLPQPSDLVLSFFNKETHHHPQIAKSEPEKVRQGRVGKSKVKAVSKGDGDVEGEDVSWEEEMRMRVREMEEMRELERKAEEIQSRTETEECGGGGGEEESEEEKRLRVKRELQKVI